MATKPAKRKVPGGRVTPKGGHQGRPGRPGGAATGAGGGPAASTRYTPPVPSSAKVSPTWVPVLMFALLGLGLLVIFCNYLGVLPGDTSNAYLLVGLGLILGGIVTATQYH